MLPNPIPSHVYSVDEAIELLCQEGCKAVRLYIERLENNAPIEILDGMSDQEKVTVLRELQSIMSVYDRCMAEQPAGLAIEI